MEHSTGKRAGLLVRIGALILDAIIIGIPLLIIEYVITGQTKDTWLSDVCQMTYSLALPVIWNGYTVGKRIVGIRIVKVNGENVGIGNMIMRDIVSALVYFLTLGIGFIVSAFMIAFREDTRSIHDFIAGTCVVYAEK
ncbi:putative RDD family membrane protein YckC [Aneurinibacillus soli]|uniref:RDD family protein n=1 Tax=Aneurinibacillus soli TaxID=1500254 RepID=A0A0U5BDF6_9BACL|nr:RDD family protein [Aneurinibacillus soli]PYE57368.1 putative RDD family membrane protein YckC [Aneurinibacillus soli]BAU28765.1 RDD family protein [Aneurinibacillus soli]